MTAVATNLDLANSSAKTSATRGKFDVSVTAEEWQFAGLATVVLAAWIGAVAAFGFAGLIVGALSLVAVMFCMLVIISRG